MNPWHADAALLERYAEDEIDPASAASIEAHLLSCAECRELLATTGNRNTLPAELIDAMWNEIADVVDRPHQAPVEWVLRRLGISEPAARIVSATPALRLAWIGAVAIVAAFAVWAAYGSTNDPIVFLWFAPVVPLAGVATAFGPSIDPLHELALAAPLPATRILALRTFAVGVTAGLVLVPASLALPGLHASAAAWIMPALAVSALALALGTVMEAGRGALVAGGLWILAVPSWIWFSTAEPRRLAAQLALFGPMGQIFWVALTVIALSIVYLRRDQFDFLAYQPGATS